MPDLRENIQSALSSCATGSLAVSSKALYNTLGYESERGASWDLDEFLEIARLINKPLPMPAIVLFRRGENDDPLVSIAIIRRRLNKRGAAKDVLDKATLIKDIRRADPIRAHLEILNDFSLPSLREFDEIPNFVKLHAAWEKKLDSYALSKDFYEEVADWYSCLPFRVVGRVRASGCGAGRQECLPHLGDAPSLSSRRHQSRQLLRPARAHGVGVLTDL